jgi:hypothetical protein
MDISIFHRRKCNISIARQISIFLLLAAGGLTLGHSFETNTEIIPAEQCSRRAHRHWVGIVVTLWAGVASSISFMWHALLGPSVTFVSGLMASWFFHQPTEYQERFSISGRRSATDTPSQ